MKRFRLNFCLLLFSALGLTIAATMLFSAGMWPEGILTAMLLALCTGGLFNLVRRLVNVMSTFVSAMEENDTTMKFDFGKDDPAMLRMTESMNRIVEIYRTSTSQLETSKLYYDRILKIMTHEMRNSITPVIALAADMEKHPERYGDNERSEAIGIIRGQSEGIKRFLESYYQLTHLPSPQTEEIEATDFFGKIHRLTVIEAKNRGLDPETCQFTVARGMTLKVDVALMTQAMINLIRNALDAVAEEKDPEVRVSVTVSDGRPYIVIADNGPGLSPEARENLFQPFFTTKDKGSGVGLCLSMQIVRRHGGDIRLINNSGTGAAFGIILNFEF